MHRGLGPGGREMGEQHRLAARETRRRFGQQPVVRGAVAGPERAHRGLDADGLDQADVEFAGHGYGTLRSEITGFSGDMPNQGAQHAIAVYKDGRVVSFKYPAEPAAGADENVTSLSSARQTK